MFDGAIGRVTAAIMARMNAAAEAEAIELLAPAPHARLLVIGFGAGVGLDLLLQRDSSLAITAVDPSAAMHVAARKRLGERAGLIDFRQSTADAIGLAPGSIDGVIAVHALQLCEPLDATAMALADALHTGAHVATITHSWAMRHHAGSTGAFLNQAHSAFRAAGFAHTEHGPARADKGGAIRFSAIR